MTKQERRSGDQWIQTYTGRRFFVTSPRPEDVDVRDVAHSLALQCRFNGHCNRFYSVAEHSMMVSERCPGEYKLWGLLHDAAEAYVGDIPTPLKEVLYRRAYGIDVELEDEVEERWEDVDGRVERVVAERFGLGWPMPAIVREVDLRVLATEKRDVMKWIPDMWSGLEGVEPYPDEIGRGKRLDLVESDFLKMFRELYPFVESKQES